MRIHYRSFVEFHEYFTLFRRAHVFLKCRTGVYRYLRFYLSVRVRPPSTSSCFSGSLASARSIMGSCDVIRHEASWSTSSQVLKFCRQKKVTILLYSWQIGLTELELCGFRLPHANVPAKGRITFYEEGRGGGVCRLSFRFTGFLLTPPPPQP